MRRYLGHILVSAETITDHFLKVQINAPGTMGDGGMEGDVVDVKPTVFAMRAAMSVFLHPDSRYYRNENLKKAMERAAAFIARNQREDGSFDYLVCNFHSAPDTSFCFHALYDTWRLMTVFAGRADTAQLRKTYESIMKPAAQAIRDGGFHTPNHRWAICAALMEAVTVFAEDREFAESCKARVRQYLQEGIDGNQDGEYAERSTGGYNGVVNSAMINLYETTKDPLYLGYAERNLHMMFQYYEPDGTIFTQNSTRQDKGKKVYADLYFAQYLYMAAEGGLSEEREKEFAAAAHKIIRDNLARGAQAPDCLYLLMLHDRMSAYRFEEYGFPAQYRKYFEESGVYRVKRERYTYTALKNKSAFLYFNADGMEVSLKIGESFCEVRNFVPQKLEVQEDGCTLSACADVWYYLPWDEKPDTSDWWQMDQSKRRLHICSRLCTEVHVKELEDGLQIGIRTEGLDRLPLRLQLCIPSGTVIRNDAVRLRASSGESMILRSGAAELALGEQILEFGNGFGEHEFQGHYSGEEVNAGGYTICCNAYTPVEKTVYLRVRR